MRIEKTKKGSLFPHTLMTKFCAIEKNKICKKEACFVKLSGGRYQSLVISKTAIFPS
jgi:hypothetical protein